MYIAAVLNSGSISLVSNYTTCGGGERTQGAMLNHV